MQATTRQQQLFREQPQCPQCQSTDLRREADDRHQCATCLWRCRIDSKGKATNWLNLAAAGRAKSKRS